MAVQSFREAGTDLLITTDVVARSLDITSVSHVINYEMPDKRLMHFHRIGRTARAGREGVALSLVSRSDEPGLANIRSMTFSRIIEIDGTSRLRPAAGSAGFFLPPRPSGRGRRGGFHRGKGTRAKLAGTESLGPPVDSRYFTMAVVA